MKKIICYSLLGLFLASCKKELATIPPQPSAKQRPVCGVDLAMANMDPSLKASLYSMARTNVQSSELLLYLDFDGAVVRQGAANSTGYNSPIVSGIRVCPTAPLTQTQIQEVIDMVEDDFSPFNIVITTDPNLFATYFAPRKHIHIITTTPNVIGMPFSVGGVAPFAGPGIRLPFNPSFTFAGLYGGDLKDVALTICQEVAHTLGLEHQHLYDSDCGLITEYHPPIGSGAISFVPIMGEGGNTRLNNWYGQACEAQDDFQFILNQVSLKADDFPNEPSGSSAITAGPVDGILEAQSDVDYILINFRDPGQVVITSDNIDIKASLYAPGGHLLGVYDDPGDVNVTIPVARGMAYLKIEAAGNENVDARFLTGKYKVEF